MTTPASRTAAGSGTRSSISSCAWRRASSSARSSRTAPTASSATASRPTTCRSWRSSPTWARRIRASSTCITRTTGADDRGRRWRGSDAGNGGALGHRSRSNELNGSGMSGEAELTETDDGTQVSLMVEGATGGHPGPHPLRQLRQPRRGRRRRSPTSTQTGMSETTVDLTIDELTGERVRDQRARIGREHHRLRRLWRHHGLIHRPGAGRAPGRPGGGDSPPGHHPEGSSPMTRTTRTSARRTASRPTPPASSSRSSPRSPSSPAPSTFARCWSSVSGAGAIEPSAPSAIDCPRRSPGAAADGARRPHPLACRTTLRGGDERVTGTGRDDARSGVPAEGARNGRSGLLPESGERSSSRRSPATATTSTRWLGSARWPWLATSSPRPSIGASRPARSTPYHAAGLRGDRRRPDRARPLRRGGRDRPGDGRSPPRPRLLLARLLSARADGGPRRRPGRHGAGGDRRLRLRRERRLGPRPARQPPLRRRRPRRSRPRATTRRSPPCPATPRHSPGRRGSPPPTAISTAPPSSTRRRCGPSPCPSTSSAYGDVLSAAGRQDEAAAQYALVAAIQQLHAANGVDTDLELALFTADHGRPEELPHAVAAGTSAGRGAPEHRRLGRARLDPLPQRRSRRRGRGQRGGPSPRHPQRADALPRRDDRRRSRRDRRRRSPSSRAPSSSIRTSPSATRPRPAPPSSDSVQPDRERRCHESYATVAAPRASHHRPSHSSESGQRIGRGHASASPRSPHAASAVAFGIGTHSQSEIRRRVVVVALLLALAPTTPAAAHPLGNFSVNQYSRHRDRDGRSASASTCSTWPSCRPSPTDRCSISDGDGAIADAERESYLDGKLSEIAPALHLFAGATELTLRPVARSLAFVPGQAGLDTTRIEATFVADLPATTGDAGQLTFRNDYASDRLGWREIVVANGPDISLDDIGRTSPSTDQTRCASIPDDLLSSPLDERTVTIAYQLVARRSGGERRASPRIAPAPAGIGERLEAIVSGGDALHQRLAPRPPRRRRLGRGARALPRTRQDRRRRLSGRQPGHAAPRALSRADGHHHAHRRGDRAGAGDPLRLAHDPARAALSVAESGLRSARRRRWG